MSFNYHRDHFGTVWGMHDVDGEVAHTACVAFGMDRLAVALFSKHGLDIPRMAARRARTARSVMRQGRALLAGRTAAAHAA